MGKITKPGKVKLVLGFIFQDESAYLKAGSFARKHFGQTDFESPAIDFHYTSYYEKEMGKGLKRRFISFKKLILPSKLPTIKIFSNRLEERLSSSGKRKINIDPGYIDMAKLVLASTKDFSHRIYLDKGIFAEITLYFQGRTFKPWPWTYPDYRTESYLDSLNKIRQLYAEQIQDIR